MEYEYIALESEFSGVENGTLHSRVVRERLPRL